ncbi:SUMF1/EgtB/PvdO family nonheme iron enzyme [uncultured Desulfobacter sp.]|uniref:SUMF1/EgtB/PvdO family nonheme iron enzyme n=1 Tax=uncultured Desulfobacter sp. TaxID=240139 RepID=UPI0029F5CC83|nr:SUMF1/EgtB/PvdO family nonheme iron enzyme [uncultured Desulfobacter sp.]
MKKETAMVQEYKIFIASPSDLGEERDIIRRVCDNLNSDPLLVGGMKKRILLTPLGWEDLPPAPGRPQDRINLILDKSHIVVGMLYRKYGTPTGDSDSGTEEEFFRAYDQWKSLEKPKIMFYFKDPGINSIEQLEDPQIKKVLGLKQKIQAEELLQYKGFRDADEFGAIFEKDLKKTLLDLIKSVKEDATILKGTEENPVPEEVLNQIPSSYKTWINDKTRCMDVGCLIEDAQGIQLILAEIYQPLFCDDPDLEEKVAKLRENYKGVLAKDPQKHSRPVEIEKLAGRRSSLLVTGLAGSGKTTLARHMARQIINDDSPYFKRGVLPVLIYFKDLKKFDWDISLSGGKGANAFLEWYCEAGFSESIEFGVIQAFCRTGRTVFILDGLDEAPLDIREKAISWFADFQHLYPGNKFILLGRPHGTGGMATKRFGQRSVRVHDLTEDQALEFIDTWFDNVYVQGLITGREIAGRMKGEIRSRHDIDALKKNPLMLTAMCILYNDLKVLPDQRADLYNRIVERLFSKFGDEKIRVANFMMALSHSLFMKGDRGMDEEEAVSILKQHFPAPGERDASYKDIFHRIEPATGLLHRENGGYRFIHLIFQEFLTARHLVDQVEDGFFEPIQEYVEDERFEEVVSLYIGFVSMRNKKAANGIVRRILESDPQCKMPHGLLVAGRSLLDIHKDNQDIGVKELAIDRMQTLIRSSHPPVVWSAAGKVMGRLDHDPGFEDFIPVQGGFYELEVEDSSSFKSIEIESFELGKFPVTNAWYQRFIKAGGYEKKEFWEDDGIKWLEKAKAAEPIYFRDRQLNCPAQPVVGVSFYEAQAFCNWMSFHDPGYKYLLPDENMWQAAAGGKERRKYPWGEKITPEHCNYNKTNLNDPSPVNIFLSGKTPEGIYDMSGNVWEWTSSFWDDSEGAYVMKGGAFDNSEEDCRCASRFSLYPVYRNYNIGFRCARIKTLNS